MAVASTHWQTASMAMPLRNKIQVTGNPPATFLLKPHH